MTLGRVDGDHHCRLLCCGKAGLAVSLISLNTGKKVTAAIMQPARIIGLRPIRSDRTPKNTKPTVPSAKDQASCTLAVKLSIIEMFCRKYRT